jgi:succinate-semialdehyde dehydrogenase/glutarate-semialdehyde dehydrogenase
MRSINPYSGETVTEIPCWDQATLESALSQAAAAALGWRNTPLQQRCAVVREIALVLRRRKRELAELITAEVGKLIAESEAEVEKCAWVCDYYAEQGPGFLQDEEIASDAGRSYVAYQPLGTVLAVMPWNFPLWQVFRFAAPALVAGNSALLKHASNVPGAARVIEEVMVEAGTPRGVFRSLMISASQVEQVVADPRVHAVTLTGSDAAGRKVAAAAGAQLKTSVLELGGSDAFIVLEDADLERAVEVGVVSRFLNGGQSCIAAKRFIVVEAIAEQFVERFREAVERLQLGDPLEPGTTLAPMARSDLRDELQRQVEASIAAGAVAVTGCAVQPGSTTAYQPSILDRVTPQAPAYREELFGPVAIVIRAQDEGDAIRIANDNPFGLGGSVWTADLERGERVAREVESGAVFVNGLVKSDPRLPFGGIKQSGYGRELSRVGMLEFVNAKTIWVA